MSGILKDHRTEDTRPLKDVGLWYVATDRALSGWGMAPRTSYVAYPVPTDSDAAKRLLEWLEARNDYKRVRLNLHLPKMHDGDHTSVYDVPENRL